MKKVLFYFVFAVICGIPACLQAQNDWANSGPNIEGARDLGLTTEQRIKIKKIRKEYSLKFAEIGKNPNLTGYEKGRKKRELALQLKTEINNLLSQKQILILSDKYDKWDFDKNVEDNVSENIDDQIDALKRRYENNVEAIENNDRLSKYEKKEQKKALKNSYKSEKEKLKLEKRKLKALL